MTGQFTVELLSQQHDRSQFSCGVGPLDAYFRERAAQDVKRRLAGCFVAVEKATGRIAGYYTLSMTGMALDDLPPDIIRRLPRYPVVPAARLGRLAVDLSQRGQGLGGALLWDAVARALRSEIAAFAMMVDAKDESAAAFYRHHGFLPFSGRPQALFFSLGTAAKHLRS